MSSFNTTDHVIAIFPSRIGDSKQFLVISQEGAAGSMEIYKKVGGKFRFALFEDDGAGGTLYDVANITSVQFLISNSTTNFVLEVKAGPFANITAPQWNGGRKPAAEHFLFQFSSDTLNLAAGEYTLSITGNTDDPLAPVDFYVQAALTVLPRADASGQATALTDSDILTALSQQVNATLASKADKIGAPGDSITLTAVNPATGQKARVILQLVFDPVIGIVFANNPEVLP
jgi:hypothetical protein